MAKIVRFMVELECSTCDTVVNTTAEIEVELQSVPFTSDSTEVKLNIYPKIPIDWLVRTNAWYCTKCKIPPK